MLMVTPPPLTGRRGCVEELSLNFTWPKHLDFHLYYLKSHNTTIHEFNYVNLFMILYVSIFKHIKDPKCSKYLLIGVPTCVQLTP